VLLLSLHPGDCHNDINAAFCGLNFPQDITACAVQVTPETNNDGALLHAVISQHPYQFSNTGVIVETFLGTTPTPEAFDISIFC
jgi:hypothetical protein